MDAGHLLKTGNFTSETPSENELWAAFNYVFSSSSSNTTSYKFGFLKSILDNLLNAELLADQLYYYIPYSVLFDKFTENYWNLIAKYRLKQLKRNKRSYTSKIETIINDAIADNPLLIHIGYLELPQNIRKRLISRVSSDCNRYVIGALYKDLGGYVYSFDKENSQGIFLSQCAFNFMIKYKKPIETMNYYAWAKFLEICNKPDDTVNLIDKLELSTPKRSDLNYFRKILYEEFEENTCFYCGKQIKNVSHVDHFIPWKYVHEDKLWNFVISCPACNEKKREKLAPKIYLEKIEVRNLKMQTNGNSNIKIEFSTYSDSLLRNLYFYAQISGYRIWEK